jgi:hypothetical protein
MWDTFFEDPTFLHLLITMTSIYFILGCQTSNFISLPENMYIMSLGPEIKTHMRVSEGAHQEGA